MYINYINYNSNFITTYKSFEEECYSDLCYKIQLLQAFKMDFFDEFILQENMKKIYYYMENNIELKNIYNLLSKKNSQIEFMKELILNDKTNTEPKQDILNIFFFQLLFSFDYFDIMHKCLSNYLNNEKNENMNSLYFEELKEYIAKN